MTVEALPWNSPELREWSIVGCNHYRVKGRRHLYVSMTRGDVCITAEHEDDDTVFAMLRVKAAAANALIAPKHAEISPEDAFTFRDFIMGYGGCVPVRSIPPVRTREAWEFVHRGWLKTAIAADRVSIVLAYTEEGARAIVLADKLMPRTG
jgi:hypothetical protein